MSLFCIWGTGCRNLKTLFLKNVTFVTLAEAVTSLNVNLAAWGGVGWGEKSTTGKNLCSFFIKVF